jgi:hypothetical protein
MDATFASVLQQLGNQGIQNLVNAQPEQDADYLGLRFLPEITKNDYRVSGGNIKVKGTLAPTIGMDSPFPEGGFVGMSSLEEMTAKFGMSVTLSEGILRELQKMLDALSLGRGGIGNREQMITNTVINFVQEMIVRPHDDQREWMRCQALTEGIIKQMSNRSQLNVDYDIPVGNKLTLKTGTSAYGRSASVWDADYRTARQKLGWAVMATIMHTSTLEQLVDNPANNLIVTNETFSPDRKTRIVNVRKKTNNGGVISFDLDARSSYTLIGYGKSGSIPNLASPGDLIEVPFIAPGRIAIFGDAVRRNLLPQTENTPRDALGYYHIGPTVEGDGRLGRWARVYTPEGRPMFIRAEGCENSLPAFDSPERVVLLSTELD